MAYARTTWVDNVTPVDASHLNNIETGIVAAEVATNKGAPSGYAPLDSGGKVPAANLPAAQDLSPYQTRSEKNQPSGYVGLDAASKIVFQGDASATLYRYAAGLVATDGLFGIFRSSPVSGALLTQVTGEAQNRWAMLADGSMTWGDGASARDTKLYRVSAAYLQTDGRFACNVAAVGSAAFNVQTVGTNRFVMFGDGKCQWYDTGGLPDTNLYRSAAGVLASDGELRASVSAAGAIGVSVRVAGDAQPRAYLSSGSSLWFGAGGSTAVDTNLYRNAAGQLRTGGSLWIGTMASQGNLETGMVVDVVNVGARVAVVGAADSGGAGYRTLRVAN